MADLTTYLKNKLYDHVLKNTAYSSPTTVYLALFTSETGDDGSGTEVSGTGYVRKAITMGSATDGVGANSAAVDFGTAGASWGTITHCAIYDAESGGNMLMHDALTAPKTVGSGDAFEIPIGDLDITFS